MENDIVYILILSAYDEDIDTNRELYLGIFSSYNQAKNKMMDDVKDSLVDYPRGYRIIKAVVDKGFVSVHEFTREGNLYDQIGMYMI